ncbi:MAG: PEGA domain-containing protein [Gemmatimonadales bacterium]
MPRVILDFDDQPTKAFPWIRSIGAGAAVLLLVTFGAVRLYRSAPDAMLRASSAALASSAETPADPINALPAATAPSPPPAPPIPRTHDPLAPTASARTVPAPRPTVERRKAPAPSPRGHPVVRAVIRTPAAPGTISINAAPWGMVAIDGHDVGNTPLLDAPISAGPHAIQVRRDGFRSYERTIDIRPGEHVRITDVALEKGAS